MLARELEASFPTSLRVRPSLRHSIDRPRDLTKPGDPSLIGDAVTVWGAVEGVNSFYTVSIDGLQPTSYSPPNTTSSRPITVLAHASNLGAGSHTLTLTSQPKDGKSRVEIDSVQLYAKTTSG